MDFDTMTTKVLEALHAFDGDDFVITAILTEKNNLYILRCDNFSSCECDGDNDSFKTIKSLVKLDDTKIIKSITMFKQGENIDYFVPCADLCDLMYSINKENINMNVKINKNQFAFYLQDLGGFK